MAEIWPRLKTKLSGEGKRKKKSGRSKSKANPYSASGLEKFATLIEVIQAKKGASLVERTTSSLSAARSISRSAQEWTATTLARSASRRNSETKLLQCAAFEALAPKPTRIVGNLEKDVTNSSERQFHRSHSHVGTEEVVPSSPEEVTSSTPVGVRLPERTSRCRAMTKVRSLHQQGWRQMSKSALVVLLAMGTFISSRFGKVGKPLAAVLTFSAVIQVWHKGKVSAKFMFSSVALYFLTPLLSYLVTRIPTRLNLLPRDLKVISSTNATEKGFRNSEIVVAQLDSSLGLSLESGADDIKESALLPVLLPIPESSPSALGVGPLPMTVVRKGNGAPSTSRRLAKKISSRFKKLKMFRSSSSTSSLTPLSTLSVSEGSHHSDAASEPNSPISPAHISRPSSPDKRRMCPFSRRLLKTKSSDIATELAQNEDSTSQSGSRKCIIMRRQRSSDTMLCKKSKLGRMLSSETLEAYNLSESMPSSASTSMHGKSTSANVDDTNNSGNAPASRDDVSWPVVGLLVTLLFLLVGRFPAIMATSLFFVVVSNAHHDRTHSRGRGRDNRALEAARKLQRSPPPRGQRWAATSPPRRF
ncbi:hypothetical protein M758_2G100100 [Ceratodon purpureus]|nr:hypothetical protein M758_2G100100 [Ceratodon purpureus]